MNLEAIPGLTVRLACAMIGATLGDALRARLDLRFPTEVREMTEETSGAQTPPSLPTSQAGTPSLGTSGTVEKDLLAIYQRLQNIEAHILDGLGPRFQALEEAVESLAKRAEAFLPEGIVNELSELKMVVASLGGGITGAPGHDAAQFFHSWWARITGQAASGRPTSTPATQTAAGASVTNSGPLAAGGAAIPLSEK